MRSSLLGLAGILAAGAQASCLHGTSLQPRQVDPATQKVATPKYGYTGADGPVQWGKYAAICSTGDNQSPINLHSGIKKVSKPPTLNYASVQSAKFENLGSTVEVLASGTTSFEGDEYKLAQCHFHTPSEHLVNKQYYPLEMHCVHERAKDKALMVVAVLFDVANGQSTKVVSDMTKHLGAIKQPGQVTNTGPLDFQEIKAHVESSPIYQYSGSLTTPPCKEGVTFLVAEKPLPLDVDSYNGIKQTVGFNSRFPQNDPGKQNVIELAAAKISQYP